METKTCSRCKEEKPVACFCKNRNMNDGLNAWCKPCIAKWKRENRKPATADQKAAKSEYDKNRRAEKGDEIRAQKRRSYRLNDGNKKRMQWYWNNHAKALALHKKYSNTDVARARKREITRGYAITLPLWYVSETLRKRTGMSPGTLPAALLEAKRYQLLIMRMCREER